MIDAAKLRKQAANKYGEVVEARLRGASIFPLYLRFTPINRTATRGEILHDIQTLRDASKDVLGCGLTLETETTDLRRHGRNELPTKASFATEADYLGYLGDDFAAEFRRICAAHAILTAAFPVLAQWTPQNWHHLRDNGNDFAANAFWQNICRAVAFFQATPFPEKYPRELPVEVPTKFIENNLLLLEKLVEVAAPASIRAAADATDAATHAGETPVPQPAAARATFRLGLKTPEALIECRFLDPAILPEWKPRRFAITLEDFAHLEKSGLSTIFITENKTNFLTLPPLSKTLAILGAGFAVARLRSVSLLSACRILYWGDIDAQGFEILATLRRHFPAVQSVMMDSATYAQFSIYQISGVPTRSAPEQFLPNLTPAESVLFQEISHQNRRLEQERIPQPHVEKILRKPIPLNCRF
ncbi:MAG: DUF2220 family protein [Puniceicoccales bacterium]|jgi:hypothetical protein|nr:DUF2220 family protein [Puniceicoccales bacterium]